MLSPYSDEIKPEQVNTCHMENSKIGIGLRPGTSHQLRLLAVILERHPWWWLLKVLQRPCLCFFCRKQQPGTESLLSIYSFLFVNSLTLWRRSRWWWWSCLLYFLRFSRASPFPCATVMKEASVVFLLCFFHCSEWLHFIRQDKSKTARKGTWNLILRIKKTIISNSP